MPQSTIAVNTANTVCRQLPHAESGSAEPFFSGFREASPFGAILLLKLAHNSCDKGLVANVSQQGSQSHSQLRNRSYLVPFSEHIAKVSIINLPGKHNRLVKRFAVGQRILNCSSHEELGA